MSFNEEKSYHAIINILVGRWENIDRNVGICTVCDCNSIVDEFHYAIGVYTFVMRKKKIFPRYYKNPYIIKFS